MRKSRRFWLVTCAAAFLSSACSEGGLRSPAGPSPLPAPRAGVTSTPTPGASVDRGTFSDWAVNTGWTTAADGIIVEGSDVITAASGQCPDHTITVRGVPITINSGTMFAPGLECESLVSGLRVHITGLLTATGDAFSVIATAISSDGDRSGPGGPGEGGNEGPGRGRHIAGEGTVASLTGSCPNLLMVVAGTRVHTNASTAFEDGDCGNLRSGTKVAVEGESNADGSITASHVRLIDQPGGTGQGRLTGEGTVASVRGECPALTMVVRGYPVMTSVDTTYSGGACGDLRPGVKVSITGVNRANSLLAELIEFKD